MCSSRWLHLWSWGGSGFLIALLHQDWSRSCLVSHPSYLATFSNDTSLGAETAQCYLLQLLLPGFGTFLRSGTVWFLCIPDWIKVPERAFFASSNLKANSPIAYLLKTILQAADSILAWRRESKLNKWQQEILARDNIELSSKFKTQNVSAAVSSVGSTGIYSDTFKAVSCIILMAFL